MNTLKKRILIITLIFVSVFFINIIKADAAAVALTNLSFECIYSDGSLFSVTWGPEFTNTAGNQVHDIVINRDIYNLSGSSSQQSSSAGGIAYVNPVDVRTADKHHCSPYVILGQVKDDEDDDEESPLTYVKFTTSSGEEFSDDEISKGDSGWWFWRKEGADQANKTKVEGQLVSESVKIYDTEPSDVVYFKRVTTNSNDPVTYVVAKKYSDFVVLVSNGRTTPIDYDFATLKSMKTGDTIYVNDPRPNAINTSSGNTAYSYSAVRFEMNTTQSNSIKYKYEKVESADDLGINPNDKLCDELLKNTAEPLRKIIGIVQLLVPALMIVLCAIDLARMVFAGKLEDEIPKARKRIIIRLIVGATFFFVPLIVNLVIYMMQDAGGANTELIQKIDCLFQ